MTFRRGFTVHPLPIALAVALLTLVAWRAWVQMSFASRASNLPRGYTTGLITANVTLVLVCLAVAGGAGAVCYFLFRRSEAAANIGIALTLILPVGLFGYQGVNFLIHGPGSRSAAGQSSAAAQQLGTGGASPGGVPTTPRIARPAPPTPSSPPTQPPPARPQDAAPSHPAPPAQPGTTERTPRIPPAEHPSTPRKEEDDPRVVETLAAINASIKTEISNLTPALKASFQDWSKAPKHDMRVLDARKAAATDLKAKASSLGKRLRELQEETKRMLAEAGVEEFAAQSESIRFAAASSAMWRASACDSIVRACDRVIEESDLLKPAYSKWNIDAKGEITSKDFAFKGRANGLRSQIEFAVRDSEELRQRLEEGR